MTEKPMLMSGEMVRAILENRKSQTRRPIKPRKPKLLQYAYYSDHPGGGFWACDVDPIANNIPFVEAKGFDSPFKVGDHVWIRETWGLTHDIYHGYYLHYKAKENDPGIRFHPIPNGIDPKKYSSGEWLKWCPSIHMPHWASRITLEITGVRVEQFPFISEQNIFAEGFGDSVFDLSKKGKFIDTWNSIYGKKYPWDSNPWVFVYEFKRITP